jgi:hypothetical protein
MEETVKPEKVRFAGIRKFLLRRVVGYRNEQRYWEWRYAHGRIKRNPNYRIEMEVKVRQVMLEHGCKNVLEIGRGVEALDGLPGYCGLDFSRNIPADIHADITKHIPLPDKTFDAVFSSGVLQHIPPENVQKAVSEMARVAKLVILDEPHTQNPTYFSWDHNYEELFKGTPMIYVTEERLL